MTTLINSHPYEKFLLGKIATTDVKGLRAADVSAATEANNSVTVGGDVVACQDYVESMVTFGDAEGGDSQNVTNLASRAGQNAPPAVPTWEAPSTFRAYVSTPETAADSVSLLRDHSGYWLLYAEHQTLGKLVAVVVFNAMSRPFAENGELVCSVTIQNSGRFLPKWVA